ncbi:hypothetical protein MKK70_01835, partial [Methylobacterium sp. E-041]|uniref:carbohydrate-binding domain-containing protein n=1 Tax=Methylobacterium sp. E-041 TaxID=2836573 RepID=UPI001FBAF11F
QTQDITLTGNFGSGAHDVAVKFIDNADNGWGNDRNLYVHQVTLDGQTYAGDLAINHAGNNSNNVANFYFNGSADWHL